MKYLISYTSNTFNGENPIYELEPLVNSQIINASFFAGSRTVPIGGAMTHLYLELDGELTEQNIYRNLRVYENLLCLTTGKPNYPNQRIDIDQSSTYDEIVSQYIADEADYNQPGIRHAGLVDEYNAVQTTAACVRFLNGMTDESRMKAERSLQTFVTAEDIGTLVNPHLKATLQATLYLSSIDQLTNPPSLCSHAIAECPDCHKENVQHQLSSHTQEIENLMRELFTGDVDRGVRLIKKGYNKVRSHFLHEGILSHGENEGGFFADTPEHTLLVEQHVNYMNTSRRLLMLYMQNRFHQNQGDSQTRV